MRHDVEIPYAQEEKHDPVQVFRFENDHINRNKCKTAAINHPSTVQRQTSYHRLTDKGL
ncbi:MAG: hypothetical protein KME52_08285 [Desmonostoc geniculatum HA4340-LM1]|nr:hypothetical protein [Desmonostoc geniculatum HA4340-LM1]